MLVVVLTANASLQAAIPWLMPGTDAHFLDPTSIERVPTGVDVCLVDVGSTAAGLALTSGLREGLLGGATPVVLIGDVEPSDPTPDGVHLVIRPVDLEHLRQLLEGFRPADERIEEEPEQAPSWLSRFLPPVLRGRTSPTDPAAVTPTTSGELPSDSSGTGSMAVPETAQDGGTPIGARAMGTPRDDPGDDEDALAPTDTAGVPVEAEHERTRRRPTASEPARRARAEVAREPTADRLEPEAHPGAADHRTETEHEPASPADAPPTGVGSERVPSSQPDGIELRPTPADEPPQQDEVTSPRGDDDAISRSVGDDRHELDSRTTDEATPAAASPGRGLVRWWARLRIARIHRKVARRLRGRGTDAPPDGVGELLDRVGEVPTLKDPAAVAAALAAELRDEGATGPIVVLLRTANGFQAIGGSDITKAQSRALVPGDHPLVELLAGRPGGLILLEGQHGGTALVRGVPLAHGDVTAVIPLHDDDGVLAIAIIGGLGGRPPALIRTVEEARDFLALLAWLESRRAANAVTGG